MQALCVLLGIALPSSVLRSSPVLDARRAVPPRCSAGVPRRKAVQLAGSALGAAVTVSPASSDALQPGDGPISGRTDRQYGPLLQGPFDFPSAPRATVRREIKPGRIWSFEQVQGVIYVQVPVRMTVVKLDAGGLFVYAPVAPTKECLALLAEVEAEHGAVTHILLPTLALEHKSFAGAFASKRPNAQLWLADAQYSFPVDLPLPLQGFPRNTRLLPPESQMASVPWATQLPYRVLGPLREKVGAYQEVAVFDAPTKTLLVTDVVVSIPSTPPAISAVSDARALLYHARDSPKDEAVDTPESRAIGWQKICLFACYFQSSPLVVLAEPDGTLGGASKFLASAFPPEVPASARALGWLGFIAWRWDSSWPKAFAALAGDGRPVMPPILQEVVLSREPAVVMDFAKRVANDFAFTTILPAHFEPVTAGPQQWLDAFRPFGPQGTNYPGALPDADLVFLRDFEKLLQAQGTIRPRGPLPSA